MFAHAFFAFALVSLATIAGCAAPSTTTTTSSSRAAVVSHADDIEPGEIMEEQAVESISR